MKNNYSVSFFSILSLLGRSGHVQPNAQRGPVLGGMAGGVAGRDLSQPLDKALKKFEKHIELGYYEGPTGGLSGKNVNSLIAANQKLESQQARVRDKADRATIEQVLDPRTRMILFKLLSR